MARTPKKVDPKAVEYALAQCRAGRSFRDVAAELHELGVDVSYGTVRRWVERADAKPEAPPPAPVAAPDTPRADPKLRQRLEAQKARAAAEAPPPEAPSDPAAPFDYEAELHRMIRDAQQEVKEYTQSSNPKAAQAAARRASDLMKVLAQQEKRKPVDPDVLTFSKAEIERAFGEVEGLLAKLCERPVLCASCSRELSVRFGRGQG